MLMVDNICHGKHIFYVLTVSKSSSKIKNKVRLPLGWVRSYVNKFKNKEDISEKFPVGEFWFAWKMIFLCM